MGRRDAADPERVLPRLPVALGMEGTALPGLGRGNLMVSVSGAARWEKPAILAG
jgi:hypothetical protein